MYKDQIQKIFEEKAAGYNEQRQKIAPMYEGLYFLLETVFSRLPDKAQILCAGVGTGPELIHFARKHPGWSFTAVEPSGPMLDICRQRVEEEGLSSRCCFHEGYLDTAPTTDLHDAATSILVSQFILDREDRLEYFKEIGRRLKPGGILAVADYSADVGSKEYEKLLRIWHRMLTPEDVSTEGLDKMRASYAKNLSILPADSITSLIRNGGFEAPTLFFQAALAHAWFTKRVSDSLG